MRVLLESDVGWVFLLVDQGAFEWLEATVDPHQYYVAGG